MILVSGDIIGDVYASNESEFKSHLFVDKIPIDKIMVGGKASNFSFSISMHKVNTLLFGNIGKDEVGQKIKRKIIDSGVIATGLTQNSTKTDCITYQYYNKDDHGEFIQNFSNQKHKAAVILDSDIESSSLVCTHLSANKNEALDLMKRAKSKGKITALNLAPYSDIKIVDLKNCDFVFLNMKEYTLLAKNLNIKEKNIQDSLKKIALVTGSTIIVTRGEGGSIFVQNDEIFEHNIDGIVNPVDTVGAGDAFMGAVLANISMGVSIYESINHGHSASNLCCNTIGAQQWQITCKN